MAFDLTNFFIGLGVGKTFIVMLISFWCAFKKKIKPYIQNRNELKKLAEKQELVKVIQETWEEMKKVTSSEEMSN